MANSGRLYVFLHGLSVICENGPTGHELVVALPAVADHVHRAGSWLNETDIEPGSLLFLNGVTAGSESIFGSSSLKPKCLDLRNPPSQSSCSLIPSSQGRAATILLPRPGTILSLLHASPIA